MKRMIFCLMFVGVLAGVCLAVSPGVWRHHTESEFDKSQLKSVVVNSHGDVTLGRKIKLLLPAKDAPAVVSSVVAAGEIIYAGSGSDGWIYKIEGDKAKTFVALPSTMITCMIMRGKELLVGGGGNKAGVYRVSKEGKVQKVFSHDDAKYVWAIVPGQDDSLYAATGPKGKVFHIDAKGKSEVIYEAGKLAKNILTLVKGVDAKLLAGTDTSGLVVKIDPAAKTARVILDAAEKEITALVADGHGGVYVATGDISKAGPTAKNGTKNGKADKKAKAKTKIPDEGEAPEPQQAPDNGNQKDESKSKKVITVTIPEGKKLPSATKNGKKYYLLPNKKTGKTLAVPVENVRVKYKNSGDKKPSKTFAKKSSKILQMMKKKAAAMKSSAKVSGKGNAVYHINAEGMVRTIFRRPVVIQAMVLHADKLILATGNEGKILFVGTDGMLSGELVDTDARQVTALVSADGALVFATSNKGSVGRIGKAYAAGGTLVSKPMDAKQIARWGTLKLIGKAPEGTKLTVATRSGNIAKAEDNTWSSWSKETPITDGFVSIGSPAARFLQYRLTLASDGKATPLLGSIQAIYQVGNLPPSIDGIVVKAGRKGNKATALTKAFRKIAIKAHDPNKDKLKFTVQYRLVNTSPWVKVTDDLKKPAYVWDTRTVGDGIYELRLTASDSPSNPTAAALEGSRISEPVVVDNTPPACRELAVNLTKNQKAKVHGLVVDSMSRIVRMSYSVDSATEWKTFLPADGICDSSEEKFRFEIDDLKAGAHRLTFRFVDIYGNTCYSGVNVTVGK